MPTLTVTVSQLLPGDYLLGSGQTVVVGPTAGLRTPRGRLELIVRVGDGHPRSVLWNARTRMKIERKEEGGANG